MTDETETHEAYSMERRKEDSRRRKNQRHSFWDEIHSADLFYESVKR